MMAMTRFTLAQVAVVSCLLVVISPLTAAYDDQTWANNEEIQSWLESWIHQYLPTSAETGQQQQQQQTHYFTPDQMDYFKNLLSTMKQGSMNDDVKQEILEHIFPKGSEENVTQQEQQTTTPADSSEEIEDDSDEETSQEPQTTTPANSEEQQVKQEPYTIAPGDSEEQTTQEQQTTTPANSEEQVKQEPNTNMPSDSEEQTTPQEQQTTTPSASGEQVKEDSEEQTTPLEPQTTTPADSEESEEQVKEDSEEQTTQQEQQTTTPTNSEEQVKQEPNTKVPSDSEEQTTPQEQQTTTPADSEEQAKEDSEEQTTSQEPQTTTPADSEESEEQAKEDSDEQTTPQEPQTTTPADSEEQVKQEPSTIAPEDSEEQTTQQEQQTTTPSDSEEQTTQYELQTTTSVDSEEHVKDDSEEQTTQEQQTTTPSDSEEQTTQQELQTTTPADSDEHSQEQEEESEDEDDESQEESAEETKSTTTPATATTTTETTTTAATTTTSTTTEVITTPEVTTTTTTEAEPATTTTTTTTTTPTTESSTTITPSPELCDNCVVHHGVGYASFPGYCDSYIQCRYYGAVLTAVYVRRCPSGQYWSQDKLTCDFEANVNCTQVNNCPNHKAIPGDWAAYLIYNGQNWTRESCPVGRTYNSVTCGCTDRHGDDNESRDNCSDKKAIAGDKTGFFQLTGNGWVRMACPATVGYNEQTCGCTDKLPADISSSVCPYTKPVPGDRSGYLQFTGVSWIFRPCPATLVYNPDICVCTYDQTNTVDDDKTNHKTQCKAKVALNFDSDDATDSSANHFWVNNTGVTFNNGKAYFNGKSRLTIPGLSNMDFGSTVYIIIKYKHSSANTKQTLVANGDCQVRQSLAVCSGKDSVDFYAETKEQISLGKITVPTDIGTWQYAVYSLDNGSLTGSVGANRVSQPVKGAVDRRQRGLVIGGGGDCDNFHGIIDEVQVFMCKPLM